MTAQALLLAVLFAAGVPSDCPEPFGEQHRYVACYEAMLADGEARGDFAQQARALMQLAWAAWQNTDLETCRARFERAAVASRKAGDAAGDARATNFLGLFLQTKLGDFDAAATHYQRALEIARRIGDCQLEGEALYHIAWLRSLRHDLPGAIRYGEQSLQARRAAGDRRGEGLTLAFLGMTSMSAGKIEECLRYQKEALPLIQESSDRRAEADVLDHIGHALSDLKRYDEAIPYHERALDLREQIEDDFDATLTLSNLAEAYRATGRFTEAAQTMQRVIERVERARENQASRQYRTSVLAQKLTYYERSIDLLMAMDEREPGGGHDAMALHMSERARARLTLDAIDRARAAGATIESDLGETRPLTAAEIQEQLLDGETMLLEYSLGAERSFVWWLTRNAIGSRPMARRHDIEVAARRLHTLLSGGDRRVSRREVSVAIDVVSRLALGGVNVPKEVRRIVIVADGPLQYVSFSALHVKGSSQPLIERFEVVTAPSASTLLAMRKLQERRSASSSAVAVIADPVFRGDDERMAGGRPVSHGQEGELPRLPFTRREAEGILQFAPRGSIGALDFEARRDLLLSGELSPFRVIHIATHAMTDGEHPGIVLSLVDVHGRKVDGIVTLSDLFRIRLQASLVVLSACRTALGNDVRGEGMVGFGRAFMHAGVPRVVATYWNVKDESTAALMRRFYRGMLVEHLSPAAALRAAQLTMLRDVTWSAPHYWAAFTLQGDWRPITDTQR